MFRPVQLPPRHSQFLVTTTDVMAARATGFAMLASRSVQEAQDIALIAQAATLRIDPVCSFL